MGKWHALERGETLLHDLFTAPVVQKLDSAIYLLNNSDEITRAFACRRHHIFLGTRRVK